MTKKANNDKTKPPIDLFNLEMIGWFTAGIVGIVLLVVFLLLEIINFYQYLNSNPTQDQQSQQVQLDKGNAIPPTPVPNKNNHNHSHSQ